MFQLIGGNPFAVVILFAVITASVLIAAEQSSNRPRAREAGVEVGILPAGPLNAITDVAGVKVGHHTLWQGDSIRTGVTVIVPHSGNLFLEKVSAAIYCGNAFGKLAGSTQVEELGTLETPIALTNTLSVPVAMQALVKYTLALPGNEEAMSVNAVVGETNDGWLNDIRGMHVQEEHVLQALRTATPGAVSEGNVGIGTSSRKLPKDFGGYTIGVLVQSNFGGILTMNGAPVGRELGKFYLSQRIAKPQDDGSCMIVVATDAPLSSRNLKRLAKRAVLGLARAGSFMANGSGDYVIAFSTVYRIPHQLPEARTQVVPELHNDAMSPLFLAVVEATEEAVYNSMFKATTVSGRDGHELEALPIEKTIKILEQYRVLNMKKRLPGVADDH
ncbi:aminopeptidase [candidate division KSB1 bacterium]|nr:MAG: aminopeptidase [candidate division KSB1 bacterium]